MKKRKYILLFIGLFFIIVFTSKVSALKKQGEFNNTTTFPFWQDQKRQEELSSQQLAEDLRHRELMEQLQLWQQQQSTRQLNNQQYTPYTETIYVPEVRQEPIYIPVADPSLQSAINRLQIENQKDLQRIQSLEKTVLALGKKVNQLELLLKIQNARNIELEKKVKLLCRAELKWRKQRE